MFKSYSTDVTRMAPLAGADAGGRGGRVDEILDEVVSYDANFEDFCGFRVETHPKTYRLMQVMTLAGWHLMMHFKNAFKRTRPSFLESRLVPIIDVPTHPSYPSSHATQSYLVALALIKVIERRDYFEPQELKSFSDSFEEPGQGHRPQPGMGRCTLRKRQRHRPHRSGPVCLNNKYPF